MTTQRYYVYRTAADGETFNADFEPDNGGDWVKFTDHESLEAELYAAQDQVTGLQELMRTNTVPALLDVAVRYLVAAAECDPGNDTTGSPQHGHRIAGRWDGDSTNAKGALCEECAAWNIMRKYAATDIVAEAQVIEDARVTQLVAQIKERDELLAKCRKTQKRLVEVADPILQRHGVSVGYFGAAERNVAAIDAMFPGAFAKEDAQ